MRLIDLYLPSDHVEIGLQLGFNLFLILKHDLLVGIVFTLIQYRPSLLAKLHLQSPYSSYYLALVEDLDNRLICEDLRASFAWRPFKPNLDLIYQFCISVNTHLP